MTKKFQLGFAGFAFFALALMGILGFLGYQTLKTPVSSDTTEIIFEVAPGMNLTQTAEKLQEAQLVRNSKVLLYYSRFTGQSTKIKVGEYSLNQSMTPDEILSILVSGKSIHRTITIAEGLNIFDIGEILSKAGIGDKAEFLQLVTDKQFIKGLLGEEQPSLEGYLFPDTYKFTKYEGLKHLVVQMVKRFLTVWTEIEVQAQAQGIKWTRHQIVTFASIVEKETGAAFERPLVSSVFHNRLKKKMRLQTDPTVIYGVAVKNGAVPINITKTDLLTPTPYNTYTMAGLPPTPIANPGREALLATLSPKASSYLYFVSQNNGTHVFSETLEKHNAAVRAFQMDPKARKGKSWKDLNKNEVKK